MIKFCKTTLGKEEKEAIGRVIDSGWVVQGQVTEEFEKQFAEYIGARHAVFVDSGTSALFLSLQWLKTQINIKTVAVPSLTFTATAEAVINAGLEPIFTDVDLYDFTMKEPDEKADIMLPVHLIGHRSFLPASIYDSAHRIMPKDLQDETALWCYSFYGTKNITTVNGGMIATNSDFAAEFLRKARDHGLSKDTKARYKDGDWAYSVDFVGWRMKADDLRAAIGIEQLKKINDINQKRAHIVMRYNTILDLKRYGLHLYPILTEKRTEFIKFMADNGIQCSVHFLPLHKMPAYQNVKRGNLENTEYLGDRLVSLPLYPGLTDEEVDFIAAKVKEFGYINE